MYSMIRFKMFSKDRFEGKSDEEILDMKKEEKINPRKRVIKSGTAAGAAIGAGYGLKKALDDPKVSERGLVGNLGKAAREVVWQGAKGAVVGNVAGRLANVATGTAAKKTAKAVHRLEKDDKELRYSDASEEKKEPKKEGLLKRVAKSPLARTAAAAAAGAAAGGLLADTKENRSKNIAAFNKKHDGMNMGDLQKRNEHAGKVMSGARFKKGAAVGGILAGAGAYAYQAHKKNQDVAERNKELIEAKKQARRREWDKE